MLNKRIIARDLAKCKELTAACAVCDERATVMARNCSLFGIGDGLNRVESQWEGGAAPAPRNVKRAKGGGYGASDKRHFRNIGAESGLNGALEVELRSEPTLPHQGVLLASFPAAAADANGRRICVGPIG
jgi:hypothetical protein